MLGLFFCDVSKAFDRVWHEGLIHKLENIGIGGNLLSFLKDYLSERYQRVVIEGQSSDLGLIKAGVPQGSVLGPLLFLIYINDLPDSIRSNIKLFADDTSLYIDVNDPVQSANVLNQDLHSLKIWADQWLVTFNASKTKLMTCSFKKSRHPDISFDNTILQETTTHKHLGLTFSNNLSWSSHISNIVKSVSPMVDVLKKLKYCLDKDSLERIYFSFIRPKIEYGCQIWDNCNVLDAKLLDDLQMNVARTVTGARKGTSHELIKQEVNWPSLSDRRKGYKLKHFNKIIAKESPSYLQSLLPHKISVNRPQSRNADHYYPIKARTETYKNSFLPSTIKLWNSLPVVNRSYDYIKSLMCHNKSSLLYYGKRETSVKHAQLRMNCSKLNYHLYLLHVLDSPVCPCGHNCEDINHFLLDCPLFAQEREIMFDGFRSICDINISCNILLYGSDFLDNSTNYKIL